MIIEEEDKNGNNSLFNLEKIREFLSLYKLPLILAGVGLLFLLTATVILIKSQFASSDVVFSSKQASPSGEMSAKIHVDIEGAVIRPGVYVLTDNDRITQALAAAGGLSADADRDWVAKNLNLAAKLSDGGKIYIPSATEVTSGKSENDLLGVTSGRVNINTATQAELEALPGIGPVTAGKIISNRPYQTVEEIKSKKVVGNAAFVKIKDLIIVY